MTVNSSSAIKTQKQSDLGAIALTADWGSPSLANVVLTDDDGKTYAFNTAHQLVEAGLGQDGVRGIDITVTLSYVPESPATNATLAAYVGTYTANISHGTSGNRLKIIDRNTVGTNTGDDLFADDADNKISFDFEIRLKTAGSAYNSTTNPYVIVAAGAADGTDTAVSKTFVVAVDGGSTSQTWADRDMANKDQENEAPAELGGQLYLSIEPKNN